MSVFPSPCPSADAWETRDPEFDPQALWTAEGTLVKKADKRKVIRSGKYFIKAFRLAPGPAGRLRDPARLEWTISLALAERGLTPKPCAYGRSGRWSYFIAQKADGLELGQYINKLQAQPDRRMTRKMAKDFAGFLVDIASCGVLQPDFHLGNILFQEPAGHLLLLDLHRAHYRGRPLSQREFTQQIISVLPPMVENLSSRNILEACSILSRHVPVLGQRAGRYNLLDKAFENMRRHWDKKEKRKIYASQRRKRTRGGLCISAAIAEEEAVKGLRALVLSPDQYMNDRTVVQEILKDSRHTLCMKAVFGSRKYFVKAYRSSGNLKAISYLARKPRSLKTWDMSWRLAYRHIPVARPVAAFQTRNPWSRIYGAVLFPWIPEAVTSKQNITDLLHEPASANLFIKHLAHFVWQMHQRGVFHGDCKITNFICFPGRKPELVLFDLDSTKILKKMRDRERIADIACMCRSLEKLGCIKDSASMFIREYARLHVPWDTCTGKIEGRIRGIILKKTRETR